MNNISKYLIALALIAMFAGCSSGSSQGVFSDSKYAKEYEGAPSWVVSPPSEGGLASVGIYKIGKSGIPMAKKIAISRAKTELAGVLKSKVKDFVEDFTRETGVADDSQTVEAVASSASKIMTQATLEGARFKTAWISSTGNYYALVIMDGNKFRDKVSDAVKTSMQDKNKMYQQFTAKKGFDKMEENLKDAFKDFKEQ